MAAHTLTLPQEQLSDRDYRRIQPLIEWILSLALDLQGDSAFASKCSAATIYISDTDYQ